MVSNSTRDKFVDLRDIPCKQGSDQWMSSAQKSVCTIYAPRDIDLSADSCIPIFSPRTVFPPQFPKALPGGSSVRRVYQAKLGQPVSLKYDPTRNFKCVCIHRHHRYVP